MTHLIIQRKDINPRKDVLLAEVTTEFESTWNVIPVGEDSRLGTGVTD